ncbi:hypothetical protein Ahy_A07g034426 [Arachis hypogaea]|uniref:MULE transposase domain-containing protein n=1 Tax=Arachis hypogaea TaxID=3818 RepID=A0A445CBT0_ARAHY|nr:hypothetical protein Ahy_A07g034426 [Arachis hypogaea]
MHMLAGKCYILYTWLKQLKVNLQEKAETWRLLFQNKFFKNIQNKRVTYTIKFTQSQLINFIDTDGVNQLISFNDETTHEYIMEVKKTNYESIPHDNNNDNLYNRLIPGKLSNDIRNDILKEYGCLFCDANNDLFPIAYAIVSAKNNKNWFWILSNLKELTGTKSVTLLWSKYMTRIDMHIVIDTLKDYKGNTRCSERRYKKVTRCSLLYLFWCRVYKSYRIASCIFTKACKLARDKKRY